MIVYSTLLIPPNILFEAALSFLGVGVRPPTASWGQMIAQATPIFNTAWWYMAFPGLALLATVLAFNLLGDGLQDALEPEGRLDERALACTHGTGGAMTRSLSMGARVLAALALARLRLEQRSARSQRRRRPSGIQTPKTQPQTGGKRGGTLTVLDHEDFENIDPGMAYFTLDYEVMYATQRPLYSYKPNTFATPIPDMASGPPEISADGKTITVHIRHGVHFSPPVNREVTSADVAYAIERGANPNVANPYFQSYFGSLEGARKGQRRSLPGHHHAEQVHDRLPPRQSRRRRSSSTRSRCR